MKLLNVYCLVLLFGYINSVKAAQDVGFINQRNQYNLLLIVLAQGTMAIESYSIDLQEHSVINRNQCTPIYSLNLSDCNDTYKILFCNPATGGSILVGSTNDLLCDYCLNWMPMVGIEIDKIKHLTYMPVTVEHKNLKVLIPREIDSVQLIIQSDVEVQNGCALVLPAQTVVKMKKSTDLMSLSEALKVGIAVPKDHASFLSADPVDQELELDQILDAMAKDGTIAIQPVSPYKVWLQFIGSALFVKCFALYSKLQAMWKYLKYGRCS